MQMGSKKAVLRRTPGWAAEAGVEVLEMAFILPLLLTLLIGIFWGARAYNIYETITRAAREGARVAVVPTCATCGNAFPTSATIQAAVNTVLGTSNISATVSVQQHQALNLDPLNTAAQWTVINVSTPFNFTLPFWQPGFVGYTSIGTVNISTQVQMLEEQ